MSQKVLSMSLMFVNFKMQSKSAVLLFHGMFSDGVTSTSSTQVESGGFLVAGFPGGKMYPIGYDCRRVYL